METFLELLIALGVFTLGLALSFFFSGTETAFYRISTIRLTIGANAGDRVAQRILQYTLQPGRFVATTLVGNNIANYLVSLGSGLAIGLFVAAGGMAEVLATWFVTPVVFVFGELLPKNISYVSPSWLLRRGASPFRLIYWLLSPATLPLALISRMLERLAGAAAGKTDLIFGRSRLTQIFSQGHQAGLLTDAQGRFLTGLLSASDNKIIETMTPADRVHVISDRADRQSVLEHGRSFALTDIIFEANDRPGQWTHYVRAAELALSDRSLLEIRRDLPRFDQSRARLEVLLELREHGDTLGAVVREDRIIGIVDERHLVESLFRAGRPLVVTSG